MKLKDLKILYEEGYLNMKGNFLYNMLKERYGLMELIPSSDFGFKKLEDDDEEELV